MDFLAVSGWLMTAVGLGVAGVQTHRTRRLEKRNREQITHLIEDANYVSFEHELLDELAPRINDPMLQRYLVSLHQRGCDLYRHWLITICRSSNASLLGISAASARPR
jgi:hypothetical protein